MNANVIGELKIFIGIISLTKSPDCPVAIQFFPITLFTKVKDWLYELLDNRAIQKLFSLIFLHKKHVVVLIS